VSAEAVIGEFARLAVGARRTAVGIVLAEERGGQQFVRCSQFPESFYFS
jgi:hypothetical protein